mgnify:CR=1 FL=1
MKGPRELSKVIAAYSPDTKVDLTVWRDGSKKDIAVTLGKLQDTEKMASAETANEQNTSLDDLGLALVTPEEAGLEGDGVVIAEVDPDGPAAEKGLRRGDRIVEVAGVTVKTPSDVVEAVSDAEKNGRKAVLFRVENNDATRFVALPMHIG